jgi:hypothetical protein
MVEKLISFFKKKPCGCAARFAPFFGWGEFMACSKSLIQSDLSDNQVIVVSRGWVEVRR